MNSIPTPSNPTFVDGSGGWQLPPLQDVFFLPGDWLVYLVSTYAPSLAAALGVGPADYGGTYSGVLSFWSWLALSIALLIAAAAVRRADRAVKRTIAAGYAYLCYRWRMLRVLAEYRRREPGRVEPTFDSRGQ